MLMLMLTMDTGEAMVDGDGEGIMEDTTDHGDMGIGDVKRDQLTKKLLLGPMLTLMPMLMLGMATMAMAWDMDMAWDIMVDITDHGDMATGDAKRGPLMSQPSLDLIPMLMLMPMLGMVTMAMPGHGHMDMVDTTDHGDMDTGEERRGPLTMK